MSTISPEHIALRRRTLGRHPLPETRERQALRLIGVSAASLLVMPLLPWGQRRTGRELGSKSVVADSKQTLLCSYLSAVLLVGLLLDAALGWGCGCVPRPGVEGHR